MGSVKKIRFGNQPEEFELITAYVGWTPRSFESWHTWFLEDIEKDRRRKPERLTLMSRDKAQSKALLMWHRVSKDAFPFNFLEEDQYRSWHRFYLVSTAEKPDIRFIIPLH